MTHPAYPLAALEGSFFALLSIDSLALKRHEEFAVHVF